MSPASVFDRVMTGAAAGRVRRTFELMEVAERVIKDQARRWRGRGAWERAQASFTLLEPSRFVAVAEAVYEDHCREIVTRAARGEDTRPGTRAEVMLALSEASLRAPLDSTGAALFERVFREVLPDGARVLDGGDAPREGYPGALGERMAEARRRTAVADRVLDPESVRKWAARRPRRARQRP